jgi:hypothetical protein
MTEFQQFKAQIARYRASRRAERRARIDADHTVRARRRDPEPSAGAAIAQIPRPWRGTMRDLHRALGPAGRPWPNARSLSVALRASQDAGITFTRSHGERRVHLR